MRIWWWMSVAVGELIHQILLGQLLFHQSLPVSLIESPVQLWSCSYDLLAYEWLVVGSSSGMQNAFVKNWWSCVEFTGRLFLTFYLLLNVSEVIC